MISKLAAHVGKYTVLAASIFAASTNAFAQTTTQNDPSPNENIDATTYQLTSADAESWMDEFLLSALEQGRIAGAAVAVVKDGRILFQKGYGKADVLNDRPVDPQKTLFRIGSVTKLFTWTAVMQLAEQGKLDIDKDIREYLDFEIPSSFTKPITLRHLMTHTAGFEENFKQIVVNDLERFPSLEAYLKSNIPNVVFEPGTTPAYSNYGTALAGYIVERVSDQKYDAYVQEHIFAPLGMTMSTASQPIPVDLSTSLSKGYLQTTDGSPYPFEMIPMAPAGSVSATPQDMAKFMIAHLNSGGAILKPETARLMHETVDQHLTPLNAMLLGFYQQNRNGHRILGHGGDTEVFHSNMSLFPDQKMGLYVVLNSKGIGGAHAAIRAQLFDMFVDRYLPASLKSTTAFTPLPAQAAKLVGTYESARGSFSNFLKFRNFEKQMTIAVGGNGNLVTQVGKHKREWTQVAPLVWQASTGNDRLAAKVENDAVVAVSFEPFSPYTTMLPVSDWQAFATLDAVLQLALIILTLSVIVWPTTEVLRWKLPHLVSKFGLFGGNIRVHRLSFLAAALVLVYLAAWGEFIDWSTTDISRLDGSSDWILACLQVAIAVPLFAVTVSGWNALASFKEPKIWLTKAWAILFFASVIVCAWYAYIAGFLNIGFAY